MRTLLVVHGFPPRAAGGTELYAEAHASTLARRHGDAVLVLAREDDRARPELAVREESRDGYRIAWVNHTFRDSTSIEDAWRAPRVVEAVRPIIETFAPETAHVHHLTCLSTLIPSMLAARGVMVTATLHDYWLMCHRGQLLDVTGARCDGPGASGCPNCLDAGSAAASSALGSAGARLLRVVDDAAPRLGSALRTAARSGRTAVGGQDAARRASLARTRHVREDVLPCIQLFFAPCAHMRDRFVRFGAPAERVRGAPYGLAGPGLRRPGPPHTGPLRVGFAGSLMLSKAPHVAMQAIARLPEGTATLDVYGDFVPYHGDRGYADEIERWSAHSAIRMRGAVEHAEVPAVLASLDVLVVPSVWEENSPFVILEAFRAGVPVVASRTGGIPELVEDAVNGLLVEPGDADALAGALARLAGDRPYLERLRARIPPVRPLEDAVAEMRAAHEMLRTRARTAQPSGRTADAESAPASARRIHAIAAVVLHYRTPSETALAVRALRAAGRPLNRVVVVDNDEVPGALDLGTVGVPVERIANGRNLGFPGGMNAGIRAALAGGADAVLLVNSDVLLPPGTACTLARTADARPRAGVVAPVVLARERPDRVASRGIRFDRATGRVRNLGIGEPFTSRSDGAWHAADAVNGAAMLVTREVFERIGLFDEDYFFSFEEIDLCARAADAGFEIGVADDAVAYHRGGATLDPRSVARFYFGTRNQLRLAARSGRPSGWMARAGRTVFVVALNVAHALTAPGGPRLARLFATARGAWDYARGRSGQFPIP
jgi:GT2 family glycosyltransferase/glycosyltransferase involved in cell wall biosynthesis